MEEKVLEPYQQRVVDENEELKEKIDKLQAFMLSPKWKELQAIDQYLLSSQLQVMQAYSQILFQRITRF